MIKINPENTIVDVLKKVSKEESEEIILDLPFGHPILHNYLSLKIIQTKTRNKKLFIISNDKTARKIGKLLGIKFIKNKGNIKEKNTIRDVIKENYTFIEYAHFEIKQLFSKIKNKIKGNITNNKKVNSFFYLKNKYGNENKDFMPYFILIFTLISFIFIYIYYFAINKTSITIYPGTIIKSKSQNFNFIEEYKGEENLYKSKNNKINLKKISTKVKLSKKIGTSGIRQEENSFSSGKVIFYNYLEKKVFLLENTTLEDENGVQFIIPKGITIPGSRVNKKGKVIPGERIQVINGKMKLINGEYSGIKTNIGKDILLEIPKLGEDKKNIFAKSISEFVGGTNEFTKIVTKEDFENAKKILLETLKSDAIKKLNDEIKILNNQNSIKVDLLPIDNIFKYTDINISLPEYLKEGDEIDYFTISGGLTISSFVFNKEAVSGLLKKSISNSVIKGQKIISINDETIRILHILERNDLYKENGKYKYKNDLKVPFIIKGTTEIEYELSKVLINNDNNFFKRLKQSVSGLSIEEAEKKLTNMPEINNVEIKIQPFFIKSISKIYENIQINIEK